LEGINTPQTLKIEGYIKKKKVIDGGTINCSRKSNKINITMGEYVINSPIIAIPMGGADVVLGIQWLQS
jgi:hypothetical protein